ncbi:MAG TPA: hypothetical protein VHA33_09620 [Candidatus Angelobacter sp.]|jgi:hypothetical protein|nr:hypothetical protein [Candidatus Angelobacter sp.]
MASTEDGVSAKVRNLTDQLQDLERDLKSQRLTDLQLIREFRDALDRSRTTAWTITELLHARTLKNNPQAALPFLLAERLRRFTQMTKDLSKDLDSDITPDGISALSDALESLQLKLKKLVKANK